ncbi:flavin-containing amine oxidase [Emericellopsis atlantica]|uniref:Amine oxidase n=1 Tax=Emericellopsis atlantica TaxID=2614577 RepID=A0A9P7ZJA6_9HYPO|nr:flavin-containing amine oxidase [Emericellopsis atlantica]KAG9252528.1 flavin-containing amine oxidase [Emericellopsis atlantica]
MFDVLVIGAGLSGLQAAYSSQQAGLSVAVIEARNRVGGKVWSVPLASADGVADLGAAWVNLNTQKRMAKYTKQFGLETVTQRLEGKAVMQEGKDERMEFPFGITPNFAADDKKDLERIRDHIQKESLKREPPRPEDDNLTLDQYIRNLGAREKTIKMINVWAQVMHGVNSTEESAAFFIDYCRTNGGLFSIRADDKTGGQHQRLVKGTQQYAEGLADLVGRQHIHLSQPVASIQDLGRHVAVTTTHGTVFHGRRCIISVPSAMYKGLNITPPLPPPNRSVYDSTKLGHYNKCIVMYRKPWWRELGFNGFFISYTGPVNIGRDTSVDSKGVYALTCFVNGSNGVEWSKLYPHERRTAVIEQLAQVYNVGNKRDADVYHPSEVYDFVWKHEPFSQGALAPITDIGHHTKYADVYGKPVGNVHFVGTEYSKEWKGYMEGALCSGEKGAAEVSEALRLQARL